MKLTDNDFALFDLPERFSLDRADLDARWRRLQGEVHPDRFAAEGAAAQRVAMQWSVRVNEAYRRLREPVSRASYLCELRGAPIAAENNTAMPAKFLAQQMDWREALDDAVDKAEVTALSVQVRDSERELLAQLGTLLDDQPDAAAAAACARALMFVQRFGSDVEQRLEDLES